jgi:hypothetical protein
MAKFTSDLSSFLEEVGEVITPEKVSLYKEVREVHQWHETERIRVAAWKEQQIQDREMRKNYATWLLIAMSFQVVAINVVYVLMGLKYLEFQPWTANTFIMSVFAQIAALVLVVVKYLFAPVSWPGDIAVGRSTKLKTEKSGGRKR